MAADRDPREPDDDGITRLPCPACGSMLTDDMDCTNKACPNGPVEDK